MIWLFGVVLMGILTALAIIDARTYRLPDVLTFPLIGAGLLFGWLVRHDWQAGLFGAAAGYGAFVLIEIAYRKIRGIDGLGRGDAKLLAAGGAWCGWAGLPFIVLIASGCGLIALLLPGMAKFRESGKLPFGPFLALGIAIVWISQGLAVSG